MKEPLNQTLANDLKTDYTIIGYGRKQHGLEGKDADLDPSGQCVVDKIELMENPQGLFLKVDFHRYANVCEPCRVEDESDEDYEMIRDVASDIVCDEMNFSGEWTGSDYWCFSSGPMSVEVAVASELFALYNKGNAKSLIPIQLWMDGIVAMLAGKIVRAIYNHEVGKSFTASMRDLNKAIGNIRNSDK